MKKLSYDSYFDKVYGCWLGKCVCGTLGAPFEGRKELMNYEFKREAIETMLENDDLDLQVLWLDVLQKKGLYIDSDDLADAFIKQCPYDLGEYAIFKRNYKRGIHAPDCGVYNNAFYNSGMGCPIRSEIWACIAPGNAGLACQYAYKDGILDHDLESVYAEQFLAAMEAEAFFETDIMTLLQNALNVIPEDARIRQCITDTIAWSTSGQDWRYTRKRVLNKYGHPDCTNLFQNIGITILSLIYGKGDIIDTSMIALNCGYDTDCTCATVGALLGIIFGEKYLKEKYDFRDTGYKLGVDVKRVNTTIYTLAEDTCKVGLDACVALNKNVSITDIPPQFTPEDNRANIKEVYMKVDYKGTPVISYKSSKTIDLCLVNESKKTIIGELFIHAPEFMLLDISQIHVRMEAGETKKFSLNIQCDLLANQVNEKNIFAAQFVSEGIAVCDYQFGIIGSAVWTMYGPFWDNAFEVQEVELGQAYALSTEGKTQEEFQDNLREYHLNTVAHIHKEYIDETSFRNTNLADPFEPSRNGTLVETFEDKINLSDLLTLEGQCIIYLVRKVVVPEDTTVCMNIGHSDPYKVWLNDEKISQSDQFTSYTPENKHVLNCKLKKGENILTLKLLRRGKDSVFSIIMGVGGFFSPHMVDISSRL